MSFVSDLFERIRIHHEKEREEEASVACCDVEGCGKPGLYRAPKGRGQERKYWHFCLDHVREYNHSYNYFSGMADQDVAAYQKEAMVGHRPTWKMGVRSDKPRPGAEKAKRQVFEDGFDPFDLFGELGGSYQRGQSQARTEMRQIRNAERKAFETLGIDPSTAPDKIKAHYKLLVKKHHPDANGGDRSHEDRLREIIQAYGYLKSAGFC